jgi:hypothetical protein
MCTFWKGEPNIEKYIFLKIETKYFGILGFGSSLL